MLDYRSSHFIKWVIMWSNLPTSNLSNLQLSISWKCGLSSLVSALVSSSNQITWQGWSILDSCCCNNNATDRYLSDGHVKMFTISGNNTRRDWRYYYQARAQLTSQVISPASPVRHLSSSQLGIYIYIIQDTRYHNTKIDHSLLIGLLSIPQ